MCHSLLCSFSFPAAGQDPACFGSQELKSFAYQVPAPTLITHLTSYAAACLSLAPHRLADRTLLPAVDVSVSPAKDKGQDSVAPASPAGPNNGRSAAAFPLQDRTPTDARLGVPAAAASRHVK